APEVRPNAAPSPPTGASMHEVEVPSSLSLAFLEELYVQYQRDPRSVPGDWQAYFARLPNGGGNGAARLGPSLPRPGLFARPAPGPALANGAEAVFEAVALQDKIVRLIREYRVRGHLRAQLDPLGQPRPSQPDLDPTFYGI